MHHAHGHIFEQPTAYPSPPVSPVLFVFLHVDYRWENFITTTFRTTVRGTVYSHYDFPHLHCHNAGHSCVVSAVTNTSHNDVSYHNALCFLFLLVLLCSLFLCGLLLPMHIVTATVYDHFYSISIDPVCIRHLFIDRVLRTAQASSQIYFCCSCWSLWSVLGAKAAQCSWQIASRYWKFLVVQEFTFHVPPLGVSTMQRDRFPRKDLHITTVILTNGTLQ